ncbi:hypothetical protein ACIBIZ_32045 [Nonomuraea spiralis]|uniref:hypothetical protein n=1 Tax=Nonomuraea TaxID=83681 RepID=UPI000F791BAB|nr:hypothetical protein [Nonomuraea sp. WAC 01424]RSN05673.1 hypothetical protein DMB42_27400 [Nonomuraea sp. WAC 01424]
MAAIWPRRLALVVAPAYSESFASWVERMALLNGCPLAEAGRPEQHYDEYDAGGSEYDDPAEASA